MVAPLTPQSLGTYDAQYAPGEKTFDPKNFAKLDPDDPDEYADRVDGNGAIYSWNGESWEKVGVVTKGPDGKFDPSTIQWGDNRTVNVANGFLDDDPDPNAIS